MNTPEIDLKGKTLYLIGGGEVHNKFDTPELIQFAINELRTDMSDVVASILSNFTLGIELVGLFINLDERDENNDIVPYVGVLNHAVEIGDNISFSNNELNEIENISRN